MSDRVLVVLPAIGTLVLDAEVYQAALAEGSKLAPAPGPPEPLLDPDQLASSLGIPVTWVEQAAREGRIPSYPFGRWRRFKRSEVEGAMRSARGNGS
jgi:excisionase family DNA binding protein